MKLGDGYCHEFGGKGRRLCSAGFTGCGHERGKAVIAVLLQH